MRICLYIAALCATAAFAQTPPELVVATGHAGPINRLAFTPDSQTLVSAGADGTIRLWDSATGAMLRKIYAYPDAIAATTADHAPGLWSLDTGLPLTTPACPQSSPGASQAASPDGKVTATGDVEGQIQIFEGKRGQSPFGMGTDPFFPPPTGKPRTVIPANTTTIGNVLFTPSGALRVFGAAANTGRIWDVGPIEQATVLPAGYLGVRSVTASPDGKFLAAFSPLQVFWWDVDPVPVAHEVRAASIEAWPLACLDDGRCAWEKNGPTGNSVNVANFRTGAAGKQFAIPDETAVALALNSDASKLAVATNQPHVQVFDAAGAQRTLPLETGPPAAPYLNRLAGRKFMLPNPDMPTAVQFSPDSKLLAAANSRGVYVWDSANFTQRAKFTVSSAVTALAFGPRGRLAAVLETGEVRIFDLAGGPEIRLTGPPSVVNLLVFCDDANILAAAGDDGIALWDLRAKTVLANIAFTASGGWIATAPDGGFDTSDRAWEQASWRIGGQTRSLVPVETYARDYFSPGLIADLLSGRVPSPRKQLASLDRHLPRVTLSKIGDYNPSSGHARVRVQIDPAGAKSATDLALYRNGRLIRSIPGKAASADFDLPMPPRTNELTAAVFNQDGLRSQSAALTLPDPRTAYPSPITTLYVLAIGINQYADPTLKLNFARADAESIADALDPPLPTSLPISIGGPPSTSPSKIVRRRLLDGDATRQGILASIRQMAAFAVPGDSFLFYYAGHSLASGEHFYLIPHDAKLGVPGSYVSEDDLNAALAPLDASHTALILDSCNSGKIVDSRDRRGPLAARGLARLTYDKGMWVLAASQTAEEAKENTGLKHGLLTYALVEEGLKAWKADPGKTGTIDLGAWLRYAADRVPSLDREVRDRTRGISTRPGARQVPQFVPDPASRELLILKSGGPAK